MAKIIIKKNSPDDILRVLISTDDLLDMCCREWMKCGVTYMDSLIDVIEDCCSHISKE